MFMNMEEYHDVNEEISCTWRNIMYMMKYHVHEKILCTWRNIMCMKKYCVHEGICTWRNIMYMKEYHVHEKILCTWRNIMYIKKYNVHEEISCTWRNIMYNLKEYNRLIQYFILNILIQFLSISLLPPPPLQTSNHHTLDPLSYNQWRVYSIVNHVVHPVIILFIFKLD